MMRIYGCIKMTITSKKEKNSYDVGSSKRTTTGLPTKEMATESFLLFPPDNV
jgi:hypothetical protein